MLMGNVYQGSAVTIEAATAQKASDGLANIRASSKPYVELRWQSPGLKEYLVQLRPTHDITDIELLYTKIFTRGWTLQERLLAPRTLSFGLQQTSFHCVTARQDEAGMFLVPGETNGYLRKELMKTMQAEQGIFKISLRYLARLVGFSYTVATPIGNWYLHGNLPLDHIGTKGTFYDYWRAIVKEFSRRELTQVTDRLPAMSGLAAEFARTTSDTYCAGLWRSELVFSLAWTTGDLYNAHGRFGIKEFSPFWNDNIYNWPAGIQASGYLAPSWSWASVKGRVEFITLKDVPFDFLPAARIVGVYLLPRFQDPFGAVERGHLDIEALSIYLPNLLSPCEQSHPFYAIHGDIQDRYMRLNDDFTNEFHQHHKPYEGQQFALLQLLTWWSGQGGYEARALECLLLETCGDGTWRRLCLVRHHPTEEIAQNNHKIITGRALDKADAKRARQFEVAPWICRRLRIS
jgi:hypothetical protein